MTLLILPACILLLVLLIAWLKMNPFLSFLIVSIITGLWLGIPLGKIAGSVEKGIGDTLGSLVILLSMGAMLGKLVADSGAAQQIASTMMKAFGEKYIQWSLVVTGFVIGIPLFYGVGFVLMVPLIFSITYKYKLPVVFIGLPMLAALSVTFGYLPPHPSPSALVVQFHADMGLTLIYGLILAVPSIVIAGPLYARFLKKIPSVPLKTFQAEELPPEKLPGKLNSFLTALLPVFLLIITTGTHFLGVKSVPLLAFFDFVSNPSVVMLISVLVATITLGTNMGRPVAGVMDIYGVAVKDIAMILLIIGGAGAFKQVLVDSGVSGQIAETLQDLDMNPLFLGWFIAAIIRVCVGSATVAGLTAAGIVAPLLLSTNANPNLMVLAVGAGSLTLSHVNDTGFWLFKEYFNLSIKDTLRSWTAMETLVSLVGLSGVLLLNAIL
ncbi:MAG: gluconate transporter [Mucilaginibacter polytrichastri]|nr:gluconate transporter [Mucilaginibacter polytrichastri]